MFFYSLAESAGDLSLRGVNPEGSQLNAPMSPKQLAPVDEDDEKPVPLSSLAKGSNMAPRALPEPVYNLEELDGSEDSNSKYQSVVHLILMYTVPVVCSHLCFLKAV